MEPVSIQASKSWSAVNLAQRALLSCGIISSLFYVAINIITPSHFPGYDIASQTVSELSAIDAPSRPLWVYLCNFYSVLVMAFGFGIWLCAYKNRRLRIVAVVMLIYGITGFFWPPMHLREVIAAGGGTFTDTLHIAFAIGTVILMLLMIGLAASALGQRFRIYSIISIILFMMFGTLTARESPGISTNHPTPWIGIWERINIGMFLLWVIVFAAALLRSDRKYSNSDGPWTVTK